MAETIPQLPSTNHQENLETIKTGISWRPFNPEDLAGGTVHNLANDVQDRGYRPDRYKELDHPFPYEITFTKDGSTTAQDRAVFLSAMAALICPDIHVSLVDKGDRHIVFNGSKEVPNEVRINNLVATSNKLLVNLSS